MLTPSRAIFMNILDINNDISFLTGADTTDYTAAQRLINVNAWYQKVITMILASQDEWDYDDFNKTDYPIVTVALTTNRDYPMPRAFTATSKLLKIKRIDVTYDGSTYYKAEPFDSGEMGSGLGNDTNTDARFDKAEPKYDLLYNAIWLYPKASSADVTAGATMRIEFLREPAEFTSAEVTTGTKEPGFDTPFHRIISIGASYDYAMALGLPNTNHLLQLTQDYEARLKQYYGSKDLDRVRQFKSAYIDYN